MEKNTDLALLQQENSLLKEQNQLLTEGLKDLKDQVSQFINPAVIPDKVETAKIPAEPVEVKLGNKTVKVKFTVPRFRLDNALEVTALEASTDAGIMQKLVENKSGVIQIVD